MKTGEPQRGHSVYVCAVQQRSSIPGTVFPHAGLVWFGGCAECSQVTICFGRLAAAAAAAAAEIEQLEWTDGQKDGRAGKTGRREAARRGRAGQGMDEDQQLPKPKPSRSYR